LTPIASLNYWLRVGGLVSSSTFSTVIFEQKCDYFTLFALFDIVRAYLLATLTLSKVTFVFPDCIVEAEMTKEVKAVQDWLNLIYVVFLGTKLLKELFHDF
jgi:hypothetical protein